MNSEIKQKWVAELKSGNYKQGTGVLKYEDTYCCLGVLCDIFIKETEKGEWVESEEDSRVAFQDKESCLTEGDLLPIGVAHWAGLTNNAHSSIDQHTKYIEVNVPYEQTYKNQFGILAVTRSLALLNDNNVSFEEIADIIDKEL